jgi:hypothetical protein
VKTVAEEGGVSVASIYIALGLSESEQLAVWKGIRPLKSATAKPVQLELPMAATPPAAIDPDDLNDDALMALIAKAGVERVLNAAAAVERTA